MLSHRVPYLIPLATFLFLMVYPALAQQVPASISYQGKLTDLSGQPVADGTYQVQFKLYTVQTGGTAFWTSAANSVTTSGGVFTTELSPINSSDLSGKTDIWLETIVGTQTLAPRAKLTSVPFAMRTDDLTLPFVGSAASSTPTFQITNTFTGDAGDFTTTGTGRAGKFVVDNPGSSSEAVHIFTNGLGYGAQINIDNPVSTANALFAWTNGKGDAMSAWTNNTGQALIATNAGWGRAGTFQVTRTDNSSEALVASTGGAGPALKAVAGTGLAGEFTGGVSISAAAQVGGFKMTNGAGSGKVLTSDTQGNGTWVSPTAGIGGTGTDNYIPRWNGTSTLENSVVYQTNGGNVGIGTTSPIYPLDVSGWVRTTTGFVFPDNTQQTTAARSFTLPYTGTGSSAMPLFSVTNTGTGSAAQFKTTNASPYAGPALYAESNVNGSAVTGRNTGPGSALRGEVYVNGTGSCGEFEIYNSSNTRDAVHAHTSGTGHGVYGESDYDHGIWGRSNTGGNTADPVVDGKAGVYGYNDVNYGVGVIGQANIGVGVFGSGGRGVQGYSYNGFGVHGVTSTGYAAYFSGPVHVQGNLSKSSGSFKIDHPLDPANKYLSHSFVESPDMMNIYNGNITTDANGDAVVVLPNYLETLNRDFRYQLTVIGQFAQAIVAEKVKDNSFKIKTDKPNVEVSWQITGIRNDPYAQKHPIIVEEEKPDSERGYYLQPGLYGEPESKSMEGARLRAINQQNAAKAGK